MNLGFPPRLPLKCFYNDCSSLSLDPESRHLVRKGFYVRSSDSRRVARFKCLICRRSFSNSRYSPCFGQKRRKLNEPIRKLLVSGVSLRRIAMLTGANRKTVVRKLVFLANLATIRHDEFLRSLRASGNGVKEIQFDEMVTFERSKCLPVSIPLVVQTRSRKILGINVCQMPSNGVLSRKSRKKYGKRADHRSSAVKALFETVEAALSSESRELVVYSDQDPRYPTWIKRAFTAGRHVAYPSRRGCVVGQGELKRGGFDPLFDLNHTCAMIRANVNRLFRRTWCTTKRRDRLLAHLMIYVDFHNSVLT